jgi:hypothetical protein
MFENQQLDPALIQALLEGSADEGDMANIEDQIALANAMRGKATGTGARSVYGVLAQGLQGYMSGKEMTEAKEARKALGQKQSSRRGKLFEAMFPNVRPGYTGEVPGEEDTWGYGD